MDGQVVLNKVAPVVDKEAVKAAEIDAMQRAAAIEREEAARRQRDEAVIAGYRRAPDRTMPESFTKVQDPNAPQVTPDIPAPPFETVGLDETALRTIADSGAKLSPSTEGAIGKLKEEDRLTARAERAAARAVPGVGIPRADEANREPNDVQTEQTSSEGSAEPNQPNQPDQPSNPNEVNKPAATSSGAKAAAAKTGSAAKSAKQ